MKLRVPARLLVVATVASTVATVFSVTPAHAAASATVTAFNGATSAPNDGTAVPVTVNATGLTLPFVHPVVEYMDASGHTSSSTFDGTAGTFGAGTQTITATLDFVDGGVPAAPGTATIEVCEASCSTPPNSVTGTLLLNGAAPSATALSPSQIGANAKQTITITGNHFARDAAVEFDENTATTPAVVPVVATTVVSETQILANVDLSAVPNGMPVDGYTVKVTNFDTQHGGAAVLTLTAPPTVTALSLPDLGPNAASTPLTITGTHFNNPAVTVVNGATARYAVTVDAAHSTTTSLASTFTATGSPADNETDTLTVTNPDGGFFSEPVTVGKTPTLATTPLSHPALGQGASGVTEVLTGTNFMASNGGPVVDFGSDITKDAPTSVTATGLTLANVAVPSSVAAGTRNITLTNPDGGHVTTSNSPLTIDAAPVITGVSPNPIATNSGASKALTLTGTGFRSGLHVDVAQGQTTVAGTVSNVTSTGATLTIDTTNLATGAYTLSPSDTDASQLATDDFGVGPAFSSLDVVSFLISTPTPAGALNGGTQPTSLAISPAGGSSIPAAQGSGYRATLTPDPAIPNQLPIVSAPGTISAGDWSGAIDLTHASPGTYDVVLSDGTNTGSCACTFSISQSSTPTIAAGGVTPNAIAQGATQQTVTLTGTGFTAGDQILFQHSGTAVSGLTVSNQVVSDFTDNDGLGKTITFTLTADPSVATGAVDVVVQESGGGASSAACAGCVTVDAPPSITSLDKTSVGQGATGFVVNVTGTNLPASGTYVFSSGGTADNGITVTNVSGSGTTATLTLSVASPSASPMSILGPNDLTVTNTADRGTATKSSALTVDPAPAPTGFAPAAVAPGAQNVAVTLTGSAFSLPATVTSDAATFTNVAQDASGNITATANIASDAVKGTLHNVVVTNADSGTATCASCLLVAVAPAWGAGRAISVAAHDGSIAVSWPTPADNGGSAVTSYSVTAQPHAGGAAIVFPAGANTTSHTFTGLANGTLYDVSVIASNVAGNSTALTGSGTPRFITSLSIRTSASRLVYGHAVTLSGALKRSNGAGLSGASIRVYRRYDGGSTTRIATVTTGTGGAWHYTFKPVHNFTGVASFGGDAADVAKNSSNVRTLVASFVHISSPSNGSTSSTAKALVATGYVSPNKAGQTVKLYYLDSAGHVHLLASTKLSSKSQYRFSVKLRRGTWRLRVLIASVTANYAGSSQTIKVKRT